MDNSIEIVKDLTTNTVTYIENVVEHRMIPWSEYYEDPNAPNYDRDGEPLYEVVDVVIGRIEYTEEEYQELLRREKEKEKEALEAYERWLVEENKKKPAAVVPKYVPHEIISIEEILKDDGLPF